MQNTITAGPLARRLAAAGLALAAAAGLAMAMAGQALAVTAGDYTDDVISTEGKVVYTLPDPADFRSLLSPAEQAALLDEAMGADVLTWTARECGATVRVQGKWHKELRYILTLDELDYVYVDCAGGTSALLSTTGEGWREKSSTGLDDFFDGDDYSLVTKSHKRQGYLVLGSRITSLDDGWAQLYMGMYSTDSDYMCSFAHVQAVVFENPSSCSRIGKAWSSRMEDREGASLVKSEGVTLTLPASAASVDARAFRNSCLGSADVSVPSGVSVPASAWYGSIDTADAARSALAAYKKAHGKVTVKVKKKRIKKGKYVYKVAFSRIEGADGAPSLYMWHHSKRIQRNVKVKGMKVILKKNAPRGKYTCGMLICAGMDGVEEEVKVTFKVV